MQRPDLLVSTKKDYPTDAYARLSWSAFDYAHPEVRQHRLDFIQRLCRRYDFDGFEMDFYRHPQFFKLGEAEQNLGTMTIDVCVFNGTTV